MDYQCEDCNEIFDADQVVVTTSKEWHEIWGANVSHTVTEYSCPFCRSEDISEYEGIEEENEDAEFYIDEN